jgi:cytochrome c-type biogenesis protein
MSFELSLIIPAFIAGLITFFTPCTLPLVPVYLAVVSGVPVKDLQDPGKAHQVHWKIFTNGAWFVLGFSVVLIALGTIAGALGQALSQYRELIVQVGGLFVIFFGLFMLQAVKIPLLDKTARLRTPKIFKQGSSVNAFVIGAVFGFGWTPCIGPILGTILLLASLSATVWQGAFLLFVFSIGLAIPFLIVAALAGSAVKRIRQISKYMHVISMIGGVFLIVLGVLLLIDKMDLLITWGYRLFGFINYESIINYL